MKSTLILCGMIAILLWSCREKETVVTLPSATISQVIEKMTEMMVNDVTNPPLAARFYAYTTLTGYEIISSQAKKSGFPNTLNEYPEIDHAYQEPVSFPLSAILAMMETSGRIQPSGAWMVDYQRKFIDSLLSNGWDEELVDHSVEYARRISSQLLAYANSDRYNRTSNYPKYTPLEEEGTWYPTPPGYFAPVEPYFNTIRPFSLDSSSQFAPREPDTYSTDTESSFYKQLIQVFKEGTDLKTENREIAAFWDCNPFALEERGHLMTGVKKISPGAHWMGITGIVCQDQQLAFDEALRVHAIVAVALTDGFIACWDEKYRSHRIRPETAIRKHLDPEWKPLLQTPPFPEYLSGHSTISTAAATVLTHLFGDHVHFRDTVELKYGLKPRTFDSFMQAADEAAISRLYGGIHFMDAIVRGQEQGRQVGSWVIAHLENEK